MEFWDALTGIGTIALAIATFVVIKQTVAAKKDEERRHQEQFRPVCVFIRPVSSDPRDPNEQLIVVNQNIRPNFNKGLLYIKMALRNVGPGTALNVRISLRIPSMGQLHLNRYELWPLAPQQIVPQNADWCIPIQLSNKFNQTDFASIEGQRWELILEYEDVFGNTFHSIHRKPPAEPWVTVAEGRIH